MDYTIVLRPEKDERDWWAGAPSIAIGPDGTTYMAARLRESISPRGRRGYEVRLLASEDGIRFDTIARVKREEVPIKGFERPALIYDESRGVFRLYLCGPWPHGGCEEWCILRLDDVKDPRDFEPGTAEPVLCSEPRQGEKDYSVRGYKDPFVWVHEKQYRMLVIGYHPERAYQFASKDGLKWARVGNGPWLDLGGWHTFYTRPACVLPMGAGWLCVYEGSNPEWFDPPYNIATGLAWSADLETCLDLTPEKPFLRSSTPGSYHTWRYSHWIWRDEELWAYAEVACPNDTNEIRLFRLPLD
jgi:hypothetical protein